MTTRALDHVFPRAACIQARAPMRRDAAEIVNPCTETMAKLLGRIVS